MRHLICTVDASPCPPESIASVPFLETVDFLSMGITPQAMAYVFSWGFGVVLSFFVMGLTLAYGLSMIRKI